MWSASWARRDVTSMHDHDECERLTHPETPDPTTAEPKEGAA